MVSVATTNERTWKYTETYIGRALKARILSKFEINPIFEAGFKLMKLT